MDGKISAPRAARVSGADGVLPLDVFNGSIPQAAVVRFKYLAPGVLLTLSGDAIAHLPELHRQQMLLVKEDAEGKVLDATRLQFAAALDDLYVSASVIQDFGVVVSGKRTRFTLWAPTARRVTLCIYENGVSSASRAEEMQWNAGTGAWLHESFADDTGKYYTYLVDVYVPSVGLARNRVTDPYSISLTTNSTRSYIADLQSPHLKPKGWESQKAPSRVKAATDMVIYELHVRDFSINDATVPVVQRGKYTAFNAIRSDGMRHLKALSDAGMTDVHLLPVFDFATVPEENCIAPSIDTRNIQPDDERPQAVVMALRDRDCFNWGYDPLHYTAPEGSYASDAADGARRIIELRQMVAALHRIGLRVGMDVVYNHTSASGQNEKSVLDRIVPGYYHRLDATGQVEKSTCCANTATENMMMAKLMVDSVVTWAREYKIDSFRFDLMGH